LQLRILCYRHHHSKTAKIMEIRSNLVLNMHGDSMEGDLQLLIRSNRQKYSISDTNLYHVENQKSIARALPHLQFQRHGLATDLLHDPYTNC
jgi:hypothetical protein